MCLALTARWPLSQKCNVSAGPRQAEAQPVLWSTFCLVPYLPSWLQAHPRSWKKMEMNRIKETLQSWQRKSFLPRCSPDCEGSEKVPVWPTQPHQLVWTNLNPTKHLAVRGSAPATSSSTNFLSEEFSCPLSHWNPLLLKANFFQSDLSILCRPHVHCRGNLPPGAGAQTLYINVW